MRLGFALRVRVGVRVRVKVRVRVGVRVGVRAPAQCVHAPSRRHSLPIISEYT